MALHVEASAGLMLLLVVVKLLLLLLSSSAIIVNVTQAALHLEGQQGAQLTIIPEQYR